MGGVFKGVLWRVCMMARVCLLDGSLRPVSRRTVYDISARERSGVYMREERRGV